MWLIFFAGKQVIKQLHSNVWAPRCFVGRKARIKIGVSEPCTQGPPSSETQYLSSELGPQAPYKWTVKTVQSLIDWLMCDFAATRTLKKK